MVRHWRLLSRAEEETQLEEVANKLERSRLAPRLPWEVNQQNLQFSTSESLQHPRTVID
jgi:hypothetical protein